MSNCRTAPPTGTLKRFTRALVLLMCICAPFTQALPEDRDKPMRITADKAERDDINGITIYTGSVILIQGTLKLTSDKLTIYHTDEDPDKIIAEGTPAKMQQRPEADKEIAYANASVITYFKSEDRVHLQTDGRVEQDGSVVNGDSIDYWINKQLIKANSNQSREGDRVVVVIPPSVTNKENDDSGATTGE